ncbi:MAG: helix-turn-helix domain-containing protein [Roseococcus sp.]
MAQQKLGVGGFSRDFAEPDDFASSLLGGQFDYVPLPNTPFRGRLEILQLNELILQIAYQGPHAARGVMSSGMSALILPLQQASVAAQMNGTEIPCTNAFIAHGGAEFHGGCTADIAWGALALPDSQLDQLAELAPLPLRDPTAAGVLSLPGGPAERLAAAMTAAGQLTTTQPEALFQPGCAEALALEMRELTAQSLTAESYMLPMPRAAREAIRVLRATEEFLQHNLDRPIFREQLCNALGVSMRKLHDAFIATTGMSPQAYLKARRLVLARRALRRGGETPAQVKAIALAHGFFHFGHFARDYRLQFGESPSSTRNARERGYFGQARSSFMTEK